MPVDLSEAYFGAIQRIEDCIAQHREEIWDEATLLSVLAAQAIAKGNHRVAEAVMNLDDALIQRLIDLDFDS